MTSAIASKSEARSAINRRRWHQERVDGEPTWRGKVWRVCGWIIAEAKTLDEERKAAILDGLLETVRDLNATNGGGSDDE